MMKTFLFFVPVILVLALLAGEVMCVVKAVNSDWEAPYKREVVYTAAALTGLGSIVGWLNVKDGE